MQHLFFPSLSKKLVQTRFLNRKHGAHGKFVGGVRTINRRLIHIISQNNSTFNFMDKLILLNEHFKLCVWINLLIKIEYKPFSKLKSSIFYVSSNTLKLEVRRFTKWNHFCLDFSKQKLKRKKIISLRLTYLVVLLHLLFADGLLWVIQADRTNMLHITKWVSPGKI